MSEPINAPSTQKLLDEVTFVRVGDRVNVPKEWMDRFIDHAASTEDDYRRVHKEKIDLLYPDTPRTEARRNGWRPIETAPKDESTVLLKVPTWGGKWNKTLPLPGRWEDRQDGGGFWITFNADEAIQRVEPTHWMPLPSAISPLVTNGPTCVNNVCRTPLQCANEKGCRAERLGQEKS